MVRYKFTWKRKVFSQSRMIVGHSYDEKQNRMVLYFEDGSLESIKHFTDCDFKLGVDYVNMQKQAMEKQAGQSIPVNIAKKG